MPHEYFSDRENGPRPRVVETIPQNVWGGIYAIITRSVDNAFFGNAFPDQCPDGYGICGTHEGLLKSTLLAEVPDIVWPIEFDKMPSILAIMDIIEFCHKYIAYPKKGNYHSFFSHYHYTYDSDEGKKQFREYINGIFSRNGIIYELDASGRIIRLAPEGLREQLLISTFFTGDNDLDDLLNTARKKYLNPDIETRKDSLEKLWDAWERLKTLEDPNDKKRSVAIILAKISPEEKFRERLDLEANELSDIGNKFRIRHHEMNKIPIESSNHVDYLFYRMFSLIYLILKSTNRIK